MKRPRAVKPTKPSEARPIETKAPEPKSLEVGPTEQLEISTVIDRVLDQVEFTAPVTMEDIGAVHDAMRANMPKNVKLETNGRTLKGQIVEVVIEARIGHDVICDRVKKVLEEKL